MWKKIPTKVALKRNGRLYANAKMEEVIVACLRGTVPDHEGRCSVSFKGDEFYSYRHYHFATVYQPQKTVLITPYGYSVSTSGHCGYVSHYARQHGYAVFHLGPTREVMLQRAKDRTIESMERIVRGHKKNAYWRWHYLNDQIEEANTMLRIFGEPELPVVTEWPETTMSFKMKYHTRKKIIKAEAITRKLTKGSIHG
jgi:hypothetical protein